MNEVILHLFALIKGGSGHSLGRGSLQRSASEAFSGSTVGKHNFYHGGAGPLTFITVFCCTVLHCTAPYYIKNGGENE